MKNRISFPSSVFLFGLLVSATPARADKAGFTWPAPEGWKTETIPFPLEFAPDLPYKGLEELRFMPGMFKPTDEFFSYAFVWWLDGPESLDVASVSRGLEKYFEGLARAVEKKPGFKAEQAKATVRLSIPGKDQKKYAGSADIYEPFATHQRLKLSVRVALSECAAEKKHVAMFLISPKPDAHEVWKKLEATAATFRCGGR